MKRILGIVVVVLGLVGSGICLGASIPAWLDDAISEWNGESPELAIRFVDIKDEFVWYRVPGIQKKSTIEVKSRANWGQTMFGISLD